MTKYGLQLRCFAIALSALAGYVDAIGFIKLGGFFVSFMSGNSTRLGVGLAEGSEQAMIAGGLILAFVAGVVLGSLVAHLGKDRRVSVVLTLVSALLALAAVLYAMGFPDLAIVATALAMGSINITFVSNGEVSISVTYMTGTLVKLGHGLAKALLGQDRFSWVGYFQLWLGLLVGAMVGAFVYPYLGLAGLWFASGIAALLAFVATRMNLDH